MGVQTTHPIEYEDIKDPKSFLSVPVLDPEEYLRIAQWKINRVFGYLSLTSIACMGAVIISPNHIVEAASIAIWASSVGLARYLLSSSYNKKGDDHHHHT
jgi:hypothetical protein